MSIPESVPEQSASRVVSEVVGKFSDELLELRRDVHAHPELSWVESRTTDLVLRTLQGTGWQTRRVPGAGAARRHRDRRCPGRPARGPGRAPGRRPHLRPVAQHRAGSRARLRSRRAHRRRWSAPPSPSSEVHARGLLPGRVRLLFQPAEEVMPGRRAAPDRGAAPSTTSTGSSACTATPASTWAGSACATARLTGAADTLSVRLDRQGRAHARAPTSPRTSPSRSASCVTELPAILSRRLDPRAGVSVVWGHGARRLRAQRDPRDRHARRHRPDARRRRLGRGGAAGRARWWSQIVAPYGVHRRGLLPARRPPVVNDLRSTALLADAVECVLGEHGHVSTSRASAARTSAGTSTGSRAPWAASAPGRREARPTTCTRATCASTSAPSTIGARVLAERRRGDPARLAGPA